MAVVPSCFCSLRDLQPHLDAQRGVEIRQRLVEQECLRLAHDGAADRDALALAAGEFARLAIEIGREVQGRGRRLDLAVDLRPRQAGHLQAEGDVVAHAHMRIERVGLEHHRQAALGRRHVDHVAGRRSGSVPPVTSSSPAIRRSSVVLPQPEGPTKTTNEPSSMSRLAPLMMLTGPNDFCDALQRDLAHDRRRLRVYLTAPKVRPRTSCRWLNQPSTRIGAIASVEAADSFAQNSPSGLE